MTALLLVTWHNGICSVCCFGVVVDLVVHFVCLLCDMFSLKQIVPRLDNLLYIVRSTVFIRKYNTTCFSLLTTLLLITWLGFVLMWWYTSSVCCGRCSLQLLLPRCAFGFPLYVVSLGYLIRKVFTFIESWKSNVVNWSIKLQHFIVELNICILYVFPFISDCIVLQLLLYFLIRSRQGMWTRMTYCWNILTLPPRLSVKVNHKELLLHIAITTIESINCCCGRSD
jgi:hypothetical protein